MSIFDDNINIMRLKSNWISHKRSIIIVIEKLALSNGCHEDTNCSMEIAT